MYFSVTPRMRRVSWNKLAEIELSGWKVTPRMRRVSWNSAGFEPAAEHKASRLAWGVWVEMKNSSSGSWRLLVTPRMRRVSWNPLLAKGLQHPLCHASHEACELKSFVPAKPNARLSVTPRMRRVSWNLFYIFAPLVCHSVTPRMRRVSWNVSIHSAKTNGIWSRLAWGVWVEICF